VIFTTELRKSAHHEDLKMRAPGWSASKWGLPKGRPLIIIGRQFSNYGALERGVGAGGDVER